MDESLPCFSGHRGLALEEPLIFEQGADGRCGVDLPLALPPDVVSPRLGGMQRTRPIGLPGLAEPQVVRHFTRLSQKNYGIDSGLFPLGSCTMKHNPRVNEKLARLPGFADLHPLQPHSTVLGSLELMQTLARWLKRLTGMPAVALAPAAGAHGELCGMMAIKAALAARGEGDRLRVLVPQSAHGTNPATAVAIGFRVDPLPSDESGRVDLGAFYAKLGTDVAAIMLTNPNTCGLFERDIGAISQAIHEVGGYFYCDGANFNAIAGRVRPADLGVDAMHINLHKSFSTPHGGGGPGAGPVVLSAALAPFAPLPWLVCGGDDGGEEGNDPCLLEWPTGAAAQTLGRLKAFHGQIGTFVRALAYMMSHGADGIAQASEDAVLSANYLLARLKCVMSAPFAGSCMHEALFDDRFLQGTGVSTLDFVKALIDQGYHPMTVYFPLVVHGALLIEPTESEDKAGLDRFIHTLRELVKAAHAGAALAFQESPRHAPRRRLDETMAARNLNLRWRAGGAG